MKNRPIAILARTVLPPLILLLGPVPALAIEEVINESAVQELEARYESADIERGQGPRHASDRAVAQAAFLDKQVRSGRQVDARNVKAAVVGDLTVVWEEGLAITELEHRWLLVDGDVEAESFDLESYVSDDAEDRSAAPAAVGLQGSLSVKGATFLSGWCVTTKSTTGNELTNCFQKYKLSTSTSTRDFFYYNRWATAVGKAVSGGYDWKPTNIDIRSRPWNTKAGDVAALVDYWPKAGTSYCSTNSFKVGYGSFSATVPIQNCTKITPIPNATSKTMGAIWDTGAIFPTNRSQGTDFAMIVSTFKGKTAVMADYNYTKFCRVSYATCDGVLRKDSGW